MPAKNKVETNLSRPRLLCNREVGAMKFHKKTGFTMIPNEIIDSDKLDGSCRAVLLALARFLPDSHPGLARISRISGLSIRTIRRKLRLMESLGVLKVIHTKGQTSQYLPYWEDRPRSYSPTPPAIQPQVPRPYSPTNNTPSNKNYLTRGKEHDFQSAHSEVKSRIRNMAKLKSIPD